MRGQTLCKKAKRKGVRHAAVNRKKTIRSFSRKKSGIRRERGAEKDRSASRSAPNRRPENTYSFAEHPFKKDFRLQFELHASMEKKLISKKKKEEGEMRLAAWERELVPERGKQLQRKKGKRPFPKERRKR